jgi:hypothetical protein
MPTHLDHHVDYDDVARRITEHEKSTGRYVWLFAAVVIGFLALWLMFTHYL